MSRLRGARERQMLTALAGLLLAASASAASPLRGAVMDQTGAPIGGAHVIATADGWQAHTDADDRGLFSINVPQPFDLRLVVSAPGFGRVEQPVARAEIDQPRRIVLPVPSVAEQVNVTAARTETRMADTPASVAVLPGDVLRSNAAPVLDQALRQVPGFTLFRRSDSRTANPTSQGVSLRGLGASGASRALVLDDGIPLNDPFGGWVYWDRVPATLLERVEVMQGGGSDLYGSAALGGVVNIVRRSAGQPVLDVGSSAGTAASRQLAFTGGGRLGAWTAMVSGEALTTAGYVPVAPDERGPIDTAANSRHAVVDVSIQRRTAGDNLAFVRASGFSETRGNGTPLQRNDTGIVQLAAGTRWMVLGGGLEARAYANGQRFNQSFSAVAADRASERLTGTQHVPADSAGASAQWSRPAGPHVFVTGFEFRQVAGSTKEASPGSRATSFADRGGHQRTTAAFFGDSLALSSSLSIAGGLRADRWTNTAGHETTWTSGNPTPDATLFEDRERTALSPRLSAIYRVGSDLSLVGQAYRAFRAPTLNELYRSFRVGNVVTQANHALEAERVSGIEAGMRLTRMGGRLYLSGRLFWMAMTQPVANVTVGSSPGLILRQRENLGAIRSRGAELDGDFRLRPGMTAHASYLFDDATVSGFPADSALVGRSVPQQPRHGATVRLRIVEPAVASISVQARWVGEQFDDDRNQFALAPYGAIDVFVSRRIARAVEIFLAGENVTNRRYEIAKTPVTMIGWPRSFRVGLRLSVASSE